MKKFIKDMTDDEIKQSFKPVYDNNENFTKENKDDLKKIVESKVFIQQLRKNFGELELFVS